VKPGFSLTTKLMCALALAVVTRQVPCKPLPKSACDRQFGMLQASSLMTDTATGRCYVEVHYHWEWPMTHENEQPYGRNHEHGGNT